MDRYHWPFMTAIVQLGMFAGFTVICFVDPVWVKPATPVVKPRIAHRPKFQKLLQAYALTLAEFPCPPESEDFGQTILVVQEPVLWNDASEPQSGDWLGSSFVWVLKSKQNQPFEDAEVLGVFLCSPDEVSTSSAASIAYDAQRHQYWMAMASGGHRLILRIHSFDPRSVVARSRSSLLNRSVDWPSYSKPVVFKKEASQDGFGFGGNYSPMIALTTKFEAVAEDSPLVLQAHSSRDWINERTPVKLWTWQYDIGQNQLSLQDRVDVAHPESILSEREDVNQTRRKQWMQMVHEIQNQNYQRSKAFAGDAK